MPVHNEAAFIERSLGAVLSQDYPHDRMEVIIADGCSSDETVTMIKEIAERTSIPITTINNPMKIAPAALNLAIGASRGEILVRVDGHCVIEPDYVSNCVELLLSGKAEGVGGPIETIGEGTQAKAIAIAMSSSFGVGGSAFRTIDDREMYTDTVAFPGYTRLIVEKVGPFNEELVRNQDDEYNFRIRKSGGRILLSPKIRSLYFSRGSFYSLWRQYFQYGYWKVRVLQMHPRQMSLRQFVPAAFVVTIMLLAFLSLFVPVARWALAGLVTLYLLANLAAGVVASRKNLLLAPLVSLSFAILHFSYGFGSLLGVFAFAGNWTDLKRTEVETR